MRRPSGPYPGCDRRFQSTHPRGVRRGQHPARTHPGPVSIHAPAWGATSARALSSFPRSVSIHAPAWGATICMVTSPFGVFSFNPRTRVGCDLFQADVNAFAGLFQSTHPRGVRRMTTNSASRSKGFQSTHPRGVRPAKGRGLRCARSRFQSTHPRGVRRQQGATRALPGMFQSTHPRGVRLVRRRGRRSVSRVSIHAPAWGATADAGRGRV